MATVLEWGHSMSDDQWAEVPSGKSEYKISVTEWRTRLQVDG